ncbi:helix-turn-helix domain-containing protein [Marinifilum flexuosum]|nr:AraC family transcriptional regulator [Marinifilum flexuosum]
MSHFNREMSTEKSMSKEEYLFLLKDFYKDLNLPYKYQDRNENHFRLERKCLPGISLNFVEFLVPYNLRYLNPDHEPIFSIGFMIQGQLDYIIHQRKYSFNTGQNNIIVVPNEDRPSLLFKAHTFYSYRSCIFEREYLEHLFSRYPEKLKALYSNYQNGKYSTLKPDNLINTSEIQFIIQQIDGEFAKPQPDDLYLEAKILELLSLQIQSFTCENFAALNLKACDRDKIREAEFLLTKDLNQAYTIEQLSREVGLNTKKLKMGFKKIFGNTIHVHLLERKMKRACHLLLKSDLNIAEVGLECGYDNASHFSTAFKKQFGVRPLDFRRGKL